MTLFLVSNEEMRFHQTYKIFELESQNTRKIYRSLFAEKSATFFRRQNRPDPALYIRKDGHNVL